MASSSVLYRFQVELSDIDNGRYNTLEFRTACHPSEDLERLVVRVLARTIADRENLEFGKGLDEPSDPALLVQSMAGRIDTWIDVGMPSAERLHRASKACGNVIVFTDKNASATKKEWSSRKIHRNESIQLYVLPHELVASLASEVDRATQLFVSIMEGTLSVSVNDESFTGEIKVMTLSDYLKD